MAKRSFSEAVASLTDDVSQYTRKDAVSVLANLPPDLANEYLVRSLGDEESLVRDACRDVLAGRGLAELADATLRLIHEWDLTGFRDQLRPSDIQTIFDVCSREHRVRGRYYENRNYSVEDAVEKAANADDFLNRLTHDESVWQWISRQLKECQQGRLSELIAIGLQTPIVIAASDLSAALTGLVFALVSGAASEARLTAAIRHVAGQGPSGKKVRLAKAIRTEDALLGAKPDAGREARLLRLAAVFEIGDLHDRAYSAAGSRNPEVAAAASALLTAVGRYRAAASIATVLATGDATVLDLADETDANRLARPFKRRLEEVWSDQNALSALWHVLKDDAIPDIIEISSGETGSAARQLLIERVGESAVGPLLTAMNREYGSRRDELMSILAVVAPPRSILQLLADPAREETAVTLARLKGGVLAHQVETVLALDSTLSPVRRDAAASAASLDAEWAAIVVPRLVRLLGDDVEFVQEAALATLSAFRDVAAASALIEALGRTAPGVRRDHLVAAITLHHAGEPRFREWLTSARAIRRRGAVLFLAEKGVPSALRDLVRDALKSGDRDTRCAAARAVAAAGDRRAVFALLAMTGDPEELVTSAASAALSVLSPALSLLGLRSTEDLRTFASEVYSALLSTTTPAPTVASPLANAMEVGATFVSTPEAVAELMTVLEGAKATNGTVSAGALRLAITVAIGAAAQCHQRSQLTAAITLQRQVAALAAAAGEPGIEWRAWLAIGEHSESLGDDSAAWSAYTRASNIIDGAWFALLEERRGREFFQDKAVLYDRLVFCALRLGYDAQAFEFTEKAKTRYLGDLIARRQRARRNELTPLVADYWLAVESRRTAASESDVGTVIAPNVLTGLGWGRCDPAESAWIPRKLDEWERNGRSSCSGILPHQVWRISAWLEPQSESESESVRHALDEIHAVLVSLRGVLDGEATASPVERVEWQQRWNAAAAQLGNVPRPAEIPLWIFAEYRDRIVTRVIEKIASDRDAAGLELDALIEALNGFLKHAPVEVVLAEREAEYEGLQLQVTSTGVAAHATPGQTPSIGEIARLQSIEWRYVERILRGEPVSYQQVRKALARDRETALIQFYASQTGAVAFLVHADEDRHASRGPDVFVFPDVTVAILNDMLFRSTGWLPLLEAWKQRNITADQWEDGAQSILSDLHRRLFSPLRERLRALGVRRLVMVPHRGLHAIPLHALCDTRTTPARRQLLLPINDNYFCQRRVSKGAPLATAAELGNCRWPVAGRG